MLLTLLRAQMRVVPALVTFGRRALSLRRPGGVVEILVSEDVPPGERDALAVRVAHASVVPANDVERVALRAVSLS